MVIQAIKTEGAATWAGTTIGTPGGFATNIPLTLTDSKMSVRVWSPDAGTPIRLKVENSNDPTQTCETEINTTLAGEWEVMEFDFLNQAPGTQTLEIGLGFGWTYNMASIFFNFGTEGIAAGEKTYFFDDVYFGEFVVGTNDFILQNIDVYPNPSNGQWTILSKNKEINLIEIFNLQGKLIRTIFPNNELTIINGTDFSDGIYFAKISTDEGIGCVKLLKE